VNWGNLDTLLLDLPPGMQRYIELCDILGKPPPSDRDDSHARVTGTRFVALCGPRRAGTEIVGIVETWSVAVPRHGCR